MPKRSSARNEKEVLSYDQAREVGDLLRFATARMPSYVEVPADAAALKAFDQKAADWGLPRIYVLSNKAAGQTSSALKALSAEFRRRALVAEIRVTAKRHADVAARWDVTTFPTLLCLADGDSNSVRHRVRFDDPKQATFRRLENFVSKCALRKPVLKKPAAKEEL